MLKKIMPLFVAALFFIFLADHADAARKTRQPRVPSKHDSHNYPPLEKMLGSMLMFGFRGQDLPDNDKFAVYLKNGQIANVILFDKDLASGESRNVTSPEQLRKLCARLHELGALFIALDQEGGQARRLRPQIGFQDLPSAQAMGQGSPHETLQKAEITGKELKDLGINVDFAPVVDVDSNPFNPAIGRLGRSFSSDAAIVAAHALAFGRGLAKNGVIPVLKHFPGQGCAESDSHLTLPDISSCWNAQIDLVPYADIFQSGWPGMVMTGHLLLKKLDPDNPATLSPGIIDGLLRKGLGWQGVVVSDDLQMKAATDQRNLKQMIRDALLAGIDILLFPNNLEWDEALPEKVIQALQELVAEKIITEERVRESWRRISSLAEVYGLFALNSQTENGDQPVQEKSQPKPKEDDNNDHADELVRQIGS